MRGEDIGMVFQNVYERLDKYFQKRLKLSGVRFEMEYWKEELIQNTYTEVLNKLQMERYEDYSLISLIFTKAGDVWANHVKEKRKTLPDSPIEEETLKTRHEALLFEQRDEIRNFETMADPDSWNMLVMSSHGYTYGEIAKHFHVSEAAVKMRVCRLKEKLQNNK